jgi:hypothetical protein
MSSWPLLDDIIGLTLGTAQHDVIVQPHPETTSKWPRRQGELMQSEQKTPTVTPTKSFSEIQPPVASG